jgi:hypothetical protein
MGILNTLIEAMQRRVVAGRMNYAERNIDYKKRKIDYKLRDKRRKSGIVSKYKFLFVRVDMPTRDKVVALAKKHKMTISEAVRSLLGALKKTAVPAKHSTTAAKLRYAIKYKSGVLRKTKTRGVRGIKVILTTYE